MPSAKETFLQRISNFENALSSPDLLSRALTDRDHNEKAKMLRNGMAIIGYTILEDFIKKRMGEVLKLIGTTTIPFGALPIKLQEAATIHALKGIEKRADHLKRNSEDYKSFIQRETEFISSTGSFPYEFSEFSLGWTKSNISEDDIKEFLTFFNVEGGWQAIQDLSGVINATLVNPKAIFKAAKERRHKAAHDANADSLLTDLVSFVSSSIVIAFAFDALVTKSFLYIKSNNPTFLNETLKTRAGDLIFRFLNFEVDKWKEYKQSTTRPFRVNTTYSIILPQTINRAITNQEMCVVKSSNVRIKDWYLL